MTQVLENVKNAWENFKGEKWKAEIDVRDFILNNVNVYEGDESFLAGATGSNETTLGSSNGFNNERT
ncbi:hypothetical protein ACT7DO_20715 [Bacillus pacificus]